MPRLTATQVKALSAPGRYPVGDGLMLEIGATGSRSWTLRIQVNKRRRDIGLGSAKDLSLNDARERAAEIRKQVRAGIDPVAERKREREPIPTFRAAAKAVHEERKATWSNGKHQDQWLATLEQHVFPRIGDKLVTDIDAREIDDVLVRIWNVVPETARRVRQRIEAVMRRMAVKYPGLVIVPDFKAIVDSLPKQPKRDGHFVAMAYKNVPALVTRLRQEVTWSRLALEALILTGVRSGEIRGAERKELDLDAAQPTWTIPAERMKAGKEHIVPLSPSAVAVFVKALELSASKTLVFPGRNPKRPMSDMTLIKLLRDLDVKVTVHGFRSSFRDWAAEETNFPGEIAEAALAHTVQNKVERAYKRTDFLAKRRQLMTAWANYIEGVPAKVIPLPAPRQHKSSSG